MQETPDSSSCPSSPSSSDSDCADLLPYDMIFVDAALSAMTCSACGEIAEMPFICTQCGAVACSNHANENCLVCGQGIWKNRCCCLSSALSSLVDLIGRGLPESFRKTSEWSRNQRPGPEVLAREVKGIAKYCSHTKGKGWLGMYLFFLREQQTREILKILRRDRFRFYYDENNRLLYMFCDPKRLATEPVTELAPSDVWMDVDFHPVEEKDEGQ